MEYQDKSRLTYYASLFNSLEVNSSFYKIPRCQTYSKWSKTVSSDFQFSVKLWKGITHNSNACFSMDDLGRFMSAIHCLDKNKGCLLIQFPRSFIIQEKYLQDILESIRKLDTNKEWRLAVEFRNSAWYNQSVYDILGKFDATLVLHDMPDSKIEDADQITSFKYVRFHGENGDYRGNYSHSFLSSKAETIRGWLNKGIDVYAYFNNTIGNAAENVITLKEMVAGYHDQNIS